MFDGGSFASQEGPITIFTTAEECGVPGLDLIHEFLSEAEERDLLNLWEVQQDRETHGGRAVKHFGIRFDYAVGRVFVFVLLIHLNSIGGVRSWLECRRETWIE